MCLLCLLIFYSIAFDSPAENFEECAEKHWASLARFFVERKDDSRKSILLITKLLRVSET